MPRTQSSLIGDNDPRQTTLNVEFGFHPVQNAEKTIAQGRPIFDDVEYISITVPGDKSNVIHRPVSAKDKVEYSEAYQAWTDDRSTGGRLGMPLAVLPFLTKSQIEELKYFKCTTVEQLAGISDGALKNIGPILELRAKARAFLKASTNG